MFCKSTLIAYLSFGIYGFTRGFRAEPCIENKDKKYLMTTKLLNGIQNGLIYLTPILNFIPLKKLVDRLEIEYNNLDKDKYIDSYYEIPGVCYDYL